MASNFQRFIFTMMVLVVSQASYAAETRYVSSVKANLLASPDFKANKLAELKKGDAIAIQSTKGAWLEAKTENNQTGWISKFLTKTTPPTDRVTVLPGDEETKLKDVRRRTSAITTAAAARGLAANKRGEKEELYKSDKKAVEYMESFEVTQKELTRFAKPLAGDTP